MRRKHIVDKISEELKSIAPEAEVFLYGSEARGEARPDSDFDILILLPDSIDIATYIAKRSEVSGRMFELSLDLEVEISPLILPKNVWIARKTPFTINVINDGIRI
ncbi:MAG: nucleotidyltransferase domain-containing protein [Bacteroides sp.]|nr:nucleotidyltransferase domain-containing protein [Bacteroides sp.]